jgi:hypothetical protein
MHSDRGRLIAVYGCGRLGKGSPKRLSIEQAMQDDLLRYQRPVGRANLFLVKTIKSYDSIENLIFHWVFFR